jgi:hypothetical protein
MVVLPGATHAMADGTVADTSLQSHVYFNPSNLVAGFDRRSFKEISVSGLKEGYNFIDLIVPGGAIMLHEVRPLRDAPTCLLTYTKPVHTLRGWP